MATGDDEWARTSLHARRACEGDAASLSWLVERFQPVLVAQARYRLGPGNSSSCDPEDLANEVWTVALPRLSSLNERDGRVTPVVLKFLGTTLLQLANNEMRRSMRRDRPADRDDRALIEISAAQREVLSEVAAGEEGRLVTDAIAALPERDREVVILRAIEQRSNGEVAALLNDSPNAVSLRYNRALEKLRDQLPRSIFADLQLD